MSTMLAAWCCTKDAYMSTSESFDSATESWPDRDAASAIGTRRGPTPIVPSDSIAGRSLSAVVAIMTFLAALAAGAAMLVASAASNWESEVARQITIQIRPIPRRELDADAASATAIVGRAPALA